MGNKFGLLELYYKALEVDANDKEKAYEVKKLFIEKMDRDREEETKKQNLTNQIVFASSAIAGMAIIPLWQIGEPSFLNLINVPLLGFVLGYLMGVPYLFLSFSKLAQQYNQKYTALKIWGISAICMMCVIATRWWLIP